MCVPIVPDDFSFIQATKDESSDSSDSDSDTASKPTAQAKLSRKRKTATAEDVGVSSDDSDSKSAQDAPATSLLVFGSFKKSAQALQPGSTTGLTKASRRSGTCLCKFNIVVLFPDLVSQNVYRDQDVRMRWLYHPPTLCLTRAVFLVNVLAAAVCSNVEELTKDSHGTNIALSVCECFTVTAWVNCNGVSMGFSPTL